MVIQVLMHKHFCSYLFLSVDPICVICVPICVYLWTLFVYTSGSSPFSIIPDLRKIHTYIPIRNYPARVFFCYISDPEVWLTWHLSGS